MWRQVLERWLSAEERQQSEQAEEALGLLFRELPRLQPLPGFADRVLARAGLVPAPAGAVSSVLRVAVAVALAATGLFATVILALLDAVSLADVVAALQPGQILTAVVGLLGSLVDWMIGGLSVWHGLSRVGGTVARIAATPEVTSVLMLCALVAILAFRMLQDLVVRERSWTHA